ncbi:MAG: ATP-binding cassette domain-containing protein [Bacteroidetes bacterium]|nr:MAG: ATP-binding cassette domain-containing protein [Bacteroidota bacterium]
MLQIQNISVKYKDKNVLQNLSLNLEKGQIHGLIGLNGAGKTTLLHSLYGLVKAIEGQILWEEKPLNYRNIAYLESHNFFYHYLTGQEYLNLFQASNQNFAVQEWNRIFDLPLSQMIENYSTGMKKKLALMAILSLDRPIIVLDEPSNGLDLEGNQLLKQILLRLKEKGKTILITSHLLEILTTICDQIHHLKQGKIKFSYQKDQFKDLEQHIFAEENQEKMIKLDSLI